MIKNSVALRSATAAAVVGLTFGLSVPVAFAQTAPAAAGNIDFAKTGSINIHKRLGAEGQDNNSGTPMAPAPGADLPADLQGKVSFKVEQLDFDLAKDFAAASKATVDSPLKSGGYSSQKSVAEGTNFANLPIGVYRVTEVVDPSVTTLVPSQPFVVFVPTTNPGGTGWNYDVNVYPKNSQVDVSKTVKDDDKQVGDMISYTITGQAPQFSKEKPLSKFWFKDTLDVRTQFDQANAEISVKTASGVDLGAGDYTVAATGTPQVLQVELTDSGLAKVKPGEIVSLTFSVKVLPSGDASDIDVVNNATVITNNPNGGSDIENTTNDVTTYYGKLKIVKTDANGDKPLAGAKFQVIKCGTTTPIAVNGISEFATGEDGTITIDGLHVTDVADNATDTSPSTFCLLETKAPEGYAKQDGEIQVGDFDSKTVESAPENTISVAVKNVRSETPNLPLTGGAGIGVLAAIGAALVGAGAWFARRNSNKG
ncbi:SpaH/EbpB family LPXTG-anchored major pilin [Corynebacterium sp. H128]|uniref:SpaH/EbpB family LPXTG-anchored major pilin n=1 Tax=Corynebacterium sp. H128 TaxID=3133427 RepID=UPI0030B50E58